MTSVYITVPNGSGWIHKHVHFATTRILQDARYRIRHDCPTHSPYVNNLHRCMWDFLDGGEDYWLSMDDDNPPRRNPLDNIELDLDLVGYPTPVWHNAVKGDRPFYFNAMEAHPGGWKPAEYISGLQRVDAIGSGCFLVARRVIEKLKDQQPFARQWKSNGLVEIGGDFSFCQKVVQAGFQIWADFDRPCSHFCEVDLMEVIQAFAEIKQCHAV